MSSGKKLPLYGVIGGLVFSSLILLAIAIEVYKGIRNSDTPTIIGMSLFFAVAFLIILAIYLSDVEIPFKRWILIFMPLLATGALVGIMFLTVEPRPRLVDETWQVIRTGCNNEKISAYGFFASDPSFYDAVPGTAAYDVTISGIHPIVIITPEERTTTMDNGDLPVEWSPASLAELELILCTTDDISIRKGTCDYVMSGSLEKYGYRRAAWLIEASTGNLVAFKEFTGKTECPGTISSGRTKPVYGDLVEIDEIINWVREYVER